MSIGVSIRLSDKGLLPEGILEYTLDQVEEAFGRFNTSDGTPKLFRRLKEYCDELRSAEIADHVIVDGSFSDDYDDLIRSLRMETDINEVILMEASALVAMVDAKLRRPLQITLGPDGLQRLFTNSCVLTAEMVREELA